MEANLAYDHYCMYGDLPATDNEYKFDMDMYQQAEAMKVSTKRNVVYKLVIVSLQVP
jgi:hypothetical protein